MKKESLKQQAYNWIKNKIIMCEYAPNELLNEEQLKEEIGASRTPIRDALSRLEQEKLVHILPKKGIIVAPLSIRDINAVYEARMIVEPYAIEYYGERIEKETYENYRDIFVRNYQAITEGSTELKELYELDDRFHIEFVHAMENEYFSNMYEQIYNQNVRLRILSGVKDIERMKHTQQEHGKITEFCLKEEWKQAADAMREHLLSGKKASFDAIIQNHDMML